MKTKPRKGQNFLRIRIMIAGVGLFAFGAASARAQQAPAAGDAAQGRKDMVTYYCYSCHGYAAEGSNDGPRIDTNKWTQANFMTYVRKGGRSMPRYATDKQIPEAALQNIYAFLKARPANPDPKSIALLSGK